MDINIETKFFWESQHGLLALPIHHRCSDFISPLCPWELIFVVMKILLAKHFAAVNIFHSGKCPLDPALIELRWRVLPYSAYIYWLLLGSKQSFITFQEMPLSSSQDNTRALMGTEAHRLIPHLTPRKKPTASARLPIPDTPLLPSPPKLSDLKFEKPRRSILTLGDHEEFQASPSHALVLAFVFRLSESAMDKKLSSVAENPVSAEVRKILIILNGISQTVETIAPVDQGGSRFGNPAFRPFLDSIATQSNAWHYSLGLTSPSAVSEISTYLHESFGNRARIDYGSGHELNFIVWLLCLNRLSLLPENTFPALALIVFPEYLHLMRKIQSTYYLEPAGSHGVWGLDDYQFLPFLIGASQLLHHPYIRPLSIHNEIVLEDEGDEYLYLNMIRFTMASKSVRDLRWTQPMLDDISAAKNWVKVEQGMRRMFVKEVLGKLPIMQHFLFGSLVPATEGMSKRAQVGLSAGYAGIEGGDVAINGGQIRHVHKDDGWGDCCGIKIPSTVAAAQEAKRHGDRGLRRIPVD